MNEESASPRGQLIPCTSCKMWLVEAMTDGARVGNMGMGLRTLEYQTNETE